MPQVEVAAKTYEALQQVAAEAGMSLEKALEQALLQFISTRAMPEEEYQRAWDELLESIRSRLPDGITAEEVDADIDAALAEVRAQNRARSH